MCAFHAEDQKLRRKWANSVNPAHYVSAGGISISDVKPAQVQTSVTVGGGWGKAG